MTAEGEEMITAMAVVEYDKTTGAIEPQYECDEIEGEDQTGYEIVEAVLGWGVYTHLILYSDGQYCLAAIA